MPERRKSLLFVSVDIVFNLLKAHRFELGYFLEVGRLFDDIFGLFCFKGVGNRKFVNKR